jgi:hypothetical protein
MDKLIIGIDPDSVKNGIALYENGKLGALHSFTTIQFYLFCEEFKGDIDSVHLENVNGNSCSSFGWKSLPNAMVKAKYSESVGKCKHAQQEIERICEHFKIKIVLHKVSSKWKNKAGKAEFERYTGWAGRSNEDTRSAAYFGFLGAK